MGVKKKGGPRLRGQIMTRVVFSSFIFRDLNSLPFHHRILSRPSSDLRRYISLSHSLLAVFVTNGQRDDIGEALLSLDHVRLTPLSPNPQTL